MFFHSVLSLAFYMAAPDKAALDAAEVAHAEGLLKELDGDVDGARVLLAQASDLAPQNLDFAYDVARIAYTKALPTLDEDSAHFMALEPRSADHRMLRTYLLARAKRFDEAKETAQKAAAIDPQNAEAVRLSQAFADSSTSGGERPWGFMALARPEVDSNVTLIPDATPFGQGGVRMGLGAAGWFRPRFSQTRLNLRVDVNGGIHLTNRANLSRFDFFTVRPMAGLEQSFGDNTVSATLSMNQVLLGGFTTHFLQDFGLLLEWRRKLPANIWASVFADLGYRDFVSPLYNVDASNTDRDGVRGMFGLNGQYLPRSFGVTLRAAFQFEQADGRDQRELGPDVQLGLRYVVWRLALSGFVGYQGRFYSLHTTGRNDHRIVPGVNASLAITQWLDVELGYLFLRNFSSVPAFDYSRHIANIGIRGHY